MDANLNYESFLTGWIAERIWPTEDFLEPIDRQYIAERRSAELTRLADENGFAAELSETVKPYNDSVLAYVKRLMWNIDYEASRLGKLKEIADRIEAA
jgi:hypothetical protein